MGKIDTTYLEVWEAADLTKGWNIAWCLVGLASFLAGDDVDDHGTS